MYAFRKSKGMQNSKTAIFKTSNAPIFNLKNSLQVLEHLLVYFIMTFSENKIAECIIRSKIGLETLVSSAFTSILSMKIQDAGKIAQIRIAIHEARFIFMMKGTNLIYLIQAIFQQKKKCNRKLKRQDGVISRIVVWVDF